MEYSVARKVSRFQARLRCGASKCWEAPCNGEEKPGTCSTVARSAAHLNRHPHAVPSPGFIAGCPAHREPAWLSRWFHMVFLWPSIPRAGAACYPIMPGRLGARGCENSMCRLRAARPASRRRSSMPSTRPKGARVVCTILGDWSGAVAAGKTGKTGKRGNRLVPSNLCRQAQQLRRATAGLRQRCQSVGSTQGTPPTHQAHQRTRGRACESHGNPAMRFFHLDRMRAAETRPEVATCTHPRCLAAFLCDPEPVSRIQYCTVAERVAHPGSITEGPRWRRCSSAATRQPASRGYPRPGLWSRGAKALHRPEILRTAWTRGACVRGPGTGAVNSKRQSYRES